MALTVCACCDGVAGMNGVVIAVLAILAIWWFLWSDHRASFYDVMVGVVAPIAGLLALIVVWTWASPLFWRWASHLF